MVFGEKGPFDYFKKNLIRKIVAILELTKSKTFSEFQAKFVNDE